MGERKYLSSFKRSRWWQWKGKCLWDESSGSGISPELVKVFRCSCSGPAHHCHSLRVLCTSLGALGKAGSCGCLGGVSGVWQHHPSAPSVLCPGRHPARTPVAPCQEAQLPPELSPGLEPSPARAGRGTVTPPALAGGCWPCWDSLEEPLACDWQDGNLPN